jgi:hypothetical protein
MKDSDVRGAVRKWLGTKYGAETRIVEEMGIWSGSVRVDLAVINGELQGFELKSERDNLDRLEGQAELYSQVFDRVTLVTAARHLDKAILKIPEWWGISCAIMRDGESKLRAVRKARRNSDVSPIQIARLLWRAESLSILERYDAVRGVKSRTAEIIAQRLAEALPIKLLATEVRHALKTRVDWLGKAVYDERQMTVGDKSRPDRPAAAARSATGEILNSLVGPTADF